MTSSINADWPQAGNALTANVRANFAATKAEILALQLQATGFNAGGTTLDGVIIGGTTPAAGAFTTLALDTDLPLTEGGTGASNEAAARTNLGLAIGSDVQAFAATLLSIAALGTAADRLAYTTGVNIWAEAVITSAARALLDDANTSAMRTTLGVAIGTDVLAYIKNNNGATTVPGATDDSAAGYEVNSIWTNTTTDKSYICLDATASSAVWTEITQAATGWVPKGHIAGLILSNDTDANNDVNVTAGEATDSTDAYVLKLTGETTKQIDATWAAGNDAGGLFTGAKAADTWYHVFLIRKDSDGTIDAGFDTSVTAANIPAGYAAYRQVGSVLTDGSSNILVFKMYELSGGGSEVIWTTPIEDLDTASQSTSAVSRTLSVPTGKSMVAIFNLHVSNATAQTYLYVRNPDTTELAASTSSPPGSSLIMTTAAADMVIGNYHLRTNTSGQVETTASRATTEVSIWTLGYIDSRR